MADMNDLRARRNELLLQTDFMMWPDYPITASGTQELETYRQALRDLPENTPDPDDVTWPTIPNVAAGYIE